jgi:hypothetical protein
VFPCYDPTKLVKSNHKKRELMGEKMAENGEKFCLELVQSAMVAATLLAFGLFEGLFPFRNRKVDQSGRANGIGIGKSG